MRFSGKHSRKQVAAKTHSEVCDATLSGNSLLPVPAPVPGDIETPNPGQWEELMVGRGELR